jgi:hypothetical protein
MRGMVCCQMDRELLEEELAVAERHLSDAERDVARQRMVVAGLEHCGRDTAGPTQLLQRLEEVLAIHIAHRDRLRKELGL